MSPRIFDAGNEAMTIISENIDGEKGQWGLLSDISRGMHSALAPSHSLDWMTKTMLTKLEEYIEPLGASRNGVEIDLDFENDIIMILLGIIPSITARKGYKARIKLIAALNECFADNGPETGSNLIKVRWAGSQKYGATQYAGNFEIGNLIGNLINATQIFCWIEITETTSGILPLFWRRGDFVSRASLRHSRALRVVAMIIMRFDLEPVTVGGEWKIPAWKHGKVASAVPPPDKDMKVSIRTREGWEDATWRYGFDGSVSKFEVFAG
ncbi:MAG: hypothetical protein Q9166_001062 [cf. Caloplaca sp. 2 TL-2023]